MQRGSEFYPRWCSQQALLNWQVDMPYSGGLNKESRQVGWFKIFYRQGPVNIPVSRQEIWGYHVFMPTFGDDLFAVKRLLPGSVAANAREERFGQNMRG